MNMFPVLVRKRVLFRQAHYLLESAHSRDTGSFLSVTAVLHNSSVFAAVCSKRTGKDRHLLLTTNVGGGGETQSLSCGGVWGGSIVLIGGAGRVLDYHSDPNGGIVFPLLDETDSCDYG